jgi:hypothetical protein
MYVQLSLIMEGSSWWVLSLCCVLPLVSADVLISEVMYAPSDFSGGSTNEWIELYNNQNTSVNLSCSFYGDMWENITFPPFGFFLIARNQEIFSATYDRKADISHGFSRGLHNIGERIDTNCTPQFDYTPLTIYANRNNFTLEMREDGTWGESLVPGGTPAKENSIWELSTEFADLHITEFMPNPFGGDDERKPRGEWVELHNGGTKSLQLNGLVLKDKDEDNELYIAQNKLMESSLLLLPDEYLVVYRDHDSDFALNNYDYEEVRLFVEETLIDSTNYAGSTEGMSWSKIDEVWYATQPTPGTKNVYREGCDWQLDIEINNAIFQSDQLEFTVRAVRLFGFPEHITVRGQIEDIFGVPIKEYQPWTDKSIVTTASKTYSPNLREGTYQVSMWFQNLTCDDSSPANNKVTKLIAINPQYQQIDSSIHIEELLTGRDEKVKWGEQFKAKINVYKGDESRHAVYLYVEEDGKRLSQTTKFNLYEAFRNYTLTLPIQLLYDCDEPRADDTVSVVLEAFGLRDETEVRLSDHADEVCYIPNTTKKISGEAYQVTSMPDSTTPGDEVPIRIQLLGDDDPHKYSVWSYLYRGNACYSCREGTTERTDNLQEVSLQPFEAAVLDFLLPVDTSLEEGEYKLKVKFNKDQQKTDKELTEEIMVLVPQGTEDHVETTGSVEEREIIVRANKEHLTGYTGFIAYESSTTKARKVIPYLLVISFLLVVVVLLKKKT